MKPTEPPFLRIQFYLTAPYPCSYLEGKEARSQVAVPAHMVGPAIYSQLIAAGFRRSGDFTYRPHCTRCEQCVPVRLPVASFVPNRAQKRCWKRNRELSVEVLPLAFSQEHYELYRRYQHSRHTGGGMDQDDREQYSQFLLSSQVNTRLVEFRDEGRLVMVSVVDWVDNGLSAVYTFFDAELQQRSLGVYAVLWQIEYARQLDMDYLYLGYWIEASRKMAYKSLYQPLEGLIDGTWQAIETTK